ncbi:fumarylacetoacetase [Sporanaerobium hydrogeniformans]|uniref:Fumarylacetoacetase n=1 Tax=Sporanaerobium hydrogeniformans TaxID=3072179 RepID=A0AC61DDK1_9FIRM|nr:fumarylacetoacetate hydrolase family protein [Sporanaerobium hydrogeniformans]PHV71414.1 fumarylacetoacetase [Sporanaerobium hydrogeniformans]
MKLLTFKRGEKEEVGVLSQEEQKVYSLSTLGLHYKDMNEWLEKGTKEEWEQIEKKLQQNLEGGFLLKEVELLAPIPRPKQDVICLGINYLAHAEESARYKKEAFGGERPYAIYFSKRVREAVQDGGVIPSYEGLVDSLDYEVELAIIIGKEAKKVSKEEAFDYVLGYTIINDISARTLQTRHKQWYFGKSLDGFCPMGPWIVTKDEIPLPPHLAISSKVNGELRQKANTSLLIFDIAHVISELSQGMTLEAGTIIAMGTPAGVGMGFEPPKFLKTGDVIECEIEGIGKLTNHIL